VEAVNRVKATSRNPGRRSAAWMVTQQVSSLALTGVFAIVFARSVPVALFGEYSFAITVTSLAVAIANGGLQGLGIKLFHDNLRSSATILNSIILVRETVGAICFLGLVVVAEATGKQALVTATIVAGLAVFIRGLDAPELYFQADLSARIPSLIRLSTSVAFFALRVVALLSTKNLMTFICLYVLEYAVTGALMLMAVWRRAHWRPWVLPPLRSTLSIARDSVPLYLSSIANQINLKVDVLILQFLVGSAAVGLYSAASRISEMLYVVPVAYMTATFPILLRAKSDLGEDTYHRQLQRAYDSSFWLGIVVVLVIVFSAGPMINMLFGHEYSVSANVLRVHALASPFVFMSAVFSKWIIAEGTLWVSIARHAAGALVAVVLNIVLVPHFGITGSAWSTVVSYATASFLFAFVSPRTRPAAAMMSRALIAPIRYSSMAINRLRTGK
jgi:O-antigen/teichoic acid export membrane protein